MNTPIQSRLGAATGGLFAVVLVVAAGDGSQSFSAGRAVAGIAAIALGIPFVAYVCSQLRAAEPRATWLPAAALVTGAAGLTLKLGSVVPELATHRLALPTSSPTHQALQELGDSATVLCLFPLALFCASVAIASFRTRALPIWLGGAAAVTAAALAVNGALIDATFVPALLLFLIWTLAASVYLTVRAVRSPVSTGPDVEAAASPTLLPPVGA